jgi:hypothetical protein
MPVSNAHRVIRDDRGSTTVEFLSLGVILLVPMVYLVLALASIQGAQLASEGAARQAARVYVQSAGSAGSADAEAARAVEYALADFGIDRDKASIDIHCAGGAACLTPGGSVSVTVRTTAVLPLIAADHGIRVEATAVQPVSRFRP